MQVSIQKFLDQTRLCADWRKRASVFEYKNMRLTLTRSDNLVTRKVAVMIGDKTDTEQMWSFLRDHLEFDSLVQGECHTVETVKSTIRAVSQSEIKQQQLRQGSLFIFVYYYGYWQKPNGSVVYTQDGDSLNLDQLTVELASHPRVYCAQWVEMGLEREGEESKESLFDAEIYQAGIRRWFALFYNSSTEKFISYFTRLLQTESQIVIPNDIQLGGFSTAFGASVDPDRIVISLQKGQQTRSNFKKVFDIWEERPQVIVERKTKWHISHLPSLHAYGDN